MEGYITFVKNQINKVTENNRYIIFPFRFYSKILKNTRYKTSIRFATPVIKLVPRELI